MKHTEGKPDLLEACKELIADIDDIEKKRFMAILGTYKSYNKLKQAISRAEGGQD